MIVAYLIGGLGNQLFQYAVARSLTKKLNTKLTLDMNWVEGDNLHYHEVYRLGDFNIPADVRSLQNRGGGVDMRFVPEENAVYVGEKRLNLVKEPSTIFHPEILDSPDDTFLSGYWQSEKYFEDIADIIREEFTLKIELSKVAKYWEDKILSAECPVSIHIRRGDYIKPSFRKHAGILPAKYFYDCVNELKKIFSNMTLFVFANDMYWARNNFTFDLKTEFVEKCDRDVEEMHLMSLCKHNIIANSTFSWWGAWLNKNPDKKVFAPKPWHQDGWGRRYNRP